MSEQPLTGYTLRDPSPNGRVLSDDLAEHLRVGRERQLAFVECELPDGGRADVLTINPVRSKLSLHVYEVKTNLRDFRKDVDSGKYERYFEYAHRVYFAVPSGLVSKDDVPRPCGLIVRGPKGWRVVKPAVPQHPKPPSVGWAITLIDRAFWKELPRLRRLADRVVVAENGEIRPKTYLYGQETARRLSRADSQADLSDEDRFALRLGRRVLELAEEGFPAKGRASSFEVDALARAALALMKNAATVRQIGSFLLGYHDESAAEIAKLLRSS